MPNRPRKTFRRYCSSMCGITVIDAVVAIGIFALLMTGAGALLNNYGAFRHQMLVRGVNEDIRNRIRQVVSCERTVAEALDSCLKKQNVIIDLIGIDGKTLINKNLTTKDLVKGDAFKGMSFKAQCSDKGGYFEIDALYTAQSFDPNDDAQKAQATAEWKSLFARSTPITCRSVGCPTNDAITSVPGVMRNSMELVFEDSRDPSDWGARDVYVCIDAGTFNVSNSPREVYSSCPQPQAFRVRTSRDSKACCRHELRVTVRDSIGNVRLTRTVDSSYKREIVWDEAHPGDKFDFEINSYNTCKGICINEWKSYTKTSPLPAPYWRPNGCTF